MLLFTDGDNDLFIIGAIDGAPCAQAALLLTPLFVGLTYTDLDEVICYLSKLAQFY